MASMPVQVPTKNNNVYKNKQTCKMTTWLNFNKSMMNMCEGLHCMNVCVLCVDGCVCCVCVCGCGCGHVLNVL